MSESSDLQAELRSLEQFHAWLESLVAAQQPLEEWGLSREALEERWLPHLQRAERHPGRLFF